LFRVARMFAIGVTVVAAALGLTFGLFLPSVARADDPPPTTVLTSTVPTPDPAPPKPKPKPAPKSAPKPAPPRAVSQTPAYQPPVAPAPSTRPTAAVKPKVRPHPKPKKKAPVKKKTTVLPKVTIAPPVGAAGVQNAFSSKSGGGSLDPGSLLIVLGLSFAIACFAVAVVPATYVKWRPAAIFVSERQVDLTVVGLALLVVSAFVLFWSARL